MGYHINVVGPESGQGQGKRTQRGEMLCAWQERVYNPSIQRQEHVSTLNRHYFFQLEASSGLSCSSASF